MGQYRCCSGRDRAALFLFTTYSITVPEGMSCAGAQRKIVVQQLQEGGGGGLMNMNMMFARGLCCAG